MTSGDARGPFRVVKRVRFSHVDSAGIVFYPRYFELYNEVVEDWFADALGCTFAQLITRYGAGVPTLKIECQFSAASRLGDDLEYELELVQLGRSSFTVEIAARHEGELRLRGSSTLVFSRVIDGRPQAETLPAELREPMARYLRAA